ncbi:MAG TPA: hypothetical protein VFE15_09100 [Marmoricola sp.]|jgi:hypothetical protein|nr:hypothetical protein [Marmoricola sp.]
MSKERARRREVREREAAARAQERAVADAKAARQRARKAAWRRRLGPLLPGGPTGRQTGLLANRRRTRLNLIIASLLFIQVITWVVRPDWQARLAAIVVAVIAFPVIAAFAL